MKIKSIEITNVKGIANINLDLDLIPNKPNILVAPNGFGKSSFSIAFQSLKSSKLELDEKNYYDGNEDNRPEIKLIVEDTVGQKTLIANDTTNSISGSFDIFVINSQLAAKATLLNIGGHPIAKSTMEITTSTLVTSIPGKVTFKYSLPTLKKAFGTNGKILSNITPILENGYLLFEIEKSIDFKKFSQVKVSKIIATIKTEINQKQGTTDEIKAWIKDEKLACFQAIGELNKLALLLSSYELPITKDITDSILTALQIVSIFQLGNSDFKKASKYQYYLEEKKEYREVIKSFNSTRIDIKPIEDKKKGLIVKWPKAYEISNGQRDVLSFIVLISKARRSFRKRDCILIIDEIFDYLDDANLISFQYFITNIIEEMKREGRNFFPLLMTHLDPMFFNHFCFNKHKMKVHYLKKVAVTASPHLLKLIRSRNESSIQSSVDQHYFHFHPSNIDITNDFKALGLNLAWSESHNFHTHIQNEETKYHTDRSDYDPLAICFGVRVRIERLLYEQILDPIKQQMFIDEHGTKKKLEFCEQIGLEVPEIYYLLGIIYNNELHWRNGIDIVSPLAIKLENLTIKKLIRDVFNT